MRSSVPYGFAQLLGNLQCAFWNDTRRALAASSIGCRISDLDLGLAGAFEQKKSRLFTFRRLVVFAHFALRYCGSQTVISFTFHKKRFLLRVGGGEIGNQGENQTEIYGYTTCK